MFPEKNGGSEKCWISLLRKQWKSIVQNKFSNVCISCTSSLCIFFTFNICMFCLSCRLSCNFDNSIVILVASDIPVVHISNTLMFVRKLLNLLNAVGSLILSCDHFAISVPCEGSSLCNFVIFTRWLMDAIH